MSPKNLEELIKASGGCESVLRTINACALPSLSICRLITMSAMLTLASPKVVPTVPITPGWSLLTMITICPSGIRSIANPSIRNTRGHWSAYTVPSTRCDSPFG